MKIVALDIATRTGVAVGIPGSAPLCSSEDLGKGLTEDERFSKVLALTDRLIRTHKPDLMAVEAAIGGPKANQYLIGLVACVRGCAANRRVPVKSYHLGSIRKHFLGKDLVVRDFPGMDRRAAKAAIKETVLKRCRLLGWDVPDHDAADAAALFDFACAMAGHSTRPSGELFEWVQPK